ncbi:MAG TPA: protein kinase [bacterium]|nr:protein kinase [bacterium]
MARDVLDGRFELQALLGSGGMAAVYRAWDRRGRRPCAVKVLADVLARDPEVRRRFRQEAAAAGALEHTYIVSVYGWGQDGLRQFIAMEYVGGGTLRERIQRDGPMPEAEALRVAAEVADALAYAHEGHVVHRDIKPHNILLTDDGHVKVADFGIALTLDGSSLTRTGTVMGSAPYVSPEQVRGETAGPASDQYALGIVLYEMLAGRAPFSGEAPLAVAYKHLHETPASLRDAGADVSPATSALVDRLLAKAPHERYPSAAALAAELHRLAAERMPAPRPRTAANGARRRGAERAGDATSRLNAPVGTLDATARLPRGAPAVEKAPAHDGHAAPSAPAPPPVRSKPAARAARPAADAGSVTQALPAAEVRAVPGQTSSFAAIPARTPDVRSDTARLRLPGRRGPTILAARAAIVAVCVFLGLAILAAAYRAAWTAAHVATPNLVGLTVADAGRKLQILRLGVLVSGTRQDPRASFGVVLAQDPRPGVDVPKGTVINVTVSGGSGLVPDLGGQTVEAASGMLERVGLRLGRVSYAISLQVASGRIIYQFQPAGTRLRPNGGVDVIVSQGFPRLPFLPQIGPNPPDHEHGG